MSIKQAVFVLITELQQLFCYTERIFVRVNHKNELYLSMISFQNEANRVNVKEIYIVVFKR